MDAEEVGQVWEANAEGWTTLSRAGYDVYRDLINTPAFLRILPPVDGLAGLDIGCGEGHNTRLLAGQGARMTGIDIAENFIRHASDVEPTSGPSIEYHVANALQLPFDDHCFDFATAFMSFQDLPNQDLALSEAYRVIRPGGFLQFSITHPCFPQTPKWGWVRDDSGRKVALTVGDYFDRPSMRVDEWTFGAAPPEASARFPKFKTPYFERTLSDWLNLLIQTGFALEEVAEPTAGNEATDEHPVEYNSRIVAFFLIVRGRKPECEV